MTLIVHKCFLLLSFLSYQSFQKRSGNVELDTFLPAQAAKQEDRKSGKIKQAAVTKEKENAATKKIASTPTKQPSKKGTPKEHQVESSTPKKKTDESTTIETLHAATTIETIAPTESPDCEFVQLPFLILQHASRIICVVV